LKKKKKKKCQYKEKEKMKMPKILENAWGPKAL